MQQIIKKKLWEVLNDTIGSLYQFCSQKGTLRVTEEGKGKIKSVFEGIITGMVEYLKKYGNKENSGKGSY